MAMARIETSTLTFDCCPTLLHLVKVSHEYCSRQFCLFKVGREGRMGELYIRYLQHNQVYYKNTNSNY